jgi:hypothetical protein
MKEDRSYYTRCWRLLARRLLHWPDQRITELVKANLKLAHWVLVSESPEYYISGYLIPKAFIKANAGTSELVSLAKEVEKAIAGESRTVLDFNTEDWEAATERVARVLQKRKGSKRGRFLVLTSRPS